MSRAAKLYDSLLANPRRVVPFRDFIGLVEAFGFVLKRQRGSHRIYRHPACPLLLNLQPRGSDAKDYQVSLFLRYVEEYRLELNR